MATQTETLCYPDGTFTYRTVTGGHKPREVCPRDYYSTSLKFSYSDDGVTPILTSVSPREINPHNRSSWNIRVDGERFDASSIVYFDGLELPTQVHSSTLLTAYLLVPGANLKPGQHKITVTTKGAHESDPLVVMAAF